MHVAYIYFRDGFRYKRRVGIVKFEVCPDDRLEIGCVVRSPRSFNPFEFDFLFFPTLDY